MAAGMKELSTWNKRNSTSHVESLRPILEGSMIMAVYMDGFPKGNMPGKERGRQREEQRGKERKQQKSQEHFLEGSVTTFQPGRRLAALVSPRAERAGCVG